MASEGCAILKLSEAVRKADGMMIYTVYFNDREPDQRSVEEAIELLAVFADVQWPFHLHCDLRHTDLGQQILYVRTYSRLIGMIANANCQQCVIAIPPGGVGQGILKSGIGHIVRMLGVSLKFVDTF